MSRHRCPADDTPCARCDAIAEERADHNEPDPGGRMADRAADRYERNLRGW